MRSSREEWREDNLNDIKMHSTIETAMAEAIVAQPQHQKPDEL